MKYNTTRKAKFIKRPNRFIAHVELDGQEEIVHVKNTGRCKEILRKNTTVVLEKANNKNRKTRYSIIAAYKNNLLINIDSQAPNKVVYESLKQRNIEQFKDIQKIKKEVTYGNSRFDIYFRNKGKEGFIEIKGVTLEKDKKVMFPDAPTTRGTKHVREMIKAVKEGYLGYIFFLVQLKGATFFTPNQEIDPEFSQTIKLAQKSGVILLAYDCQVTENTLTLQNQIPIKI